VKVCVRVCVRVCVCVVILYWTQAHARISLLPGVLLALILGFEGPATTEELWVTGRARLLNALAIFLSNSFSCCLPLS
jgi:hypothetical protein